MAETCGGWVSVRVSKYGGVKKGRMRGSRVEVVWWCVLIHLG